MCTVHPQCIQTSLNTNAESFEMSLICLEFVFPFWVCSRLAIHGLWTQTSDIQIRGSCGISKSFLAAPLKSFQHFFASSTFADAHYSYHVIHVIFGKYDVKCEAVFIERSSFFSSVQSISKGLICKKVLF